LEWLIFLINIKEDPTSNLGPETGYLTEVLVVFFSFSRKMQG
jgi:hypothetical protein